MENGIPLIITYNSAFRNLANTLKKNFSIFYSDVEVRPVFMVSLIVCHRSSRNLKRFLVESKVYPLEKTVGSSKCGLKRFKISLNFSEADIFESFQTKR